MGDPSGIGPEIIVKALTKLREDNWPKISIFGHESRIREISKQLGLQSLHQMPGVQIISPPHLQDQDLKWGELTPEGSQAQVAYIEMALAAIDRGEIDALVTGPIHKQALAYCGLPYCGHTEWLQSHAQVKCVAMMLAGARLRVVPVTTHIPLREVVSQLNTQKVFDTIALVARSMPSWFGIADPKIAICSINPHAGDGGLFGNEEEVILKPAIAQAKDRGIKVTDPLPADTIFYFALQGHYDVVIGMYHDQVLGPLKIAHFGEAVNITLGLPYSRISVDHGTAYDIAGLGIANSSSMEYALQLAMARLQQNS